MGSCSQPVTTQVTVRMVRDVFHINGFLLTDTSGHVVQIVFNQTAPLASALVHPLRKLLL